MITKITKVNVTEKNAKGELYRDKNGNPFKQVSIQIDHPDYVGRYLSTNVFKADAPELQLVAGEEKNIFVTSRTWQGKEYLNFKIAGKYELMSEDIKALYALVGALDARLTLVEDITPTPTRNAPPKAEISQERPEDLPF